VFIDLHTHAIRTQQDLIAIFNAPPVSRPENVPDHWLVSTGIHPWLCDNARFTNTCQALQVTELACHSPSDSPDYNKTIQRMLDTLAQMAAEHQIDALGEIGLDRLQGGNLSAQITLLETQLAIAEQHNLPVIIHCVRAYPELLAVRKRFTKTPWLIHAFNGNLQMAKQLQSHNCHLSFNAMLQRKPKLQDVVQAITANSIFLETDASKTKIEDLYHTAAAILSLDIADVQKQIATHFQEVFPPSQTGAT